MKIHVCTHVQCINQQSKYRTGLESQKMLHVNAYCVLIFRKGRDLLRLEAKLNQVQVNKWKPKQFRTVMIVITMDRGKACKIKSFVTFALKNFRM
jgi:hypothetical protein